VRPEQRALRAQICQIATSLAGVSGELREISHGIYPGILSKGGLGAALKALARRSTVPVELDLTLDRQLPESVVVAAYFVLAEALTNAAKHAQASKVNVLVDAEAADLRVSIRDDGIGGADATRGSGLSGLVDRAFRCGHRSPYRRCAGTRIPVARPVTDAVQQWPTTLSTSRSRTASSITQWTRVRACRIRLPTSVALRRTCGVTAGLRPCPHQSKLCIPASVQRLSRRHGRLTTHSFPANDLVGCDPHRHAIRSGIRQ
jgi:hypothetical protein